jgi:hypothetical protein
MHSFCPRLQLLQSSLEAINRHDSRPKLLAVLLVFVVGFHRGVQPTSTFSRRGELAAFLLIRGRRVVVQELLQAVEDLGFHQNVTFLGARVRQMQWFIVVDIQCLLLRFVEFQRHTSVPPLHLG